jgi:hypothetical protein
MGWLEASRGGPLRIRKSLRAKTRSNLNCAQIHAERRGWFSFFFLPSSTRGPGRSILLWSTSGVQANDLDQAFAPKADETRTAMSMVVQAK